MILMILFWVVIIVGGLYLIKLLIGGANGGNRTESAEETLKKRYARGEIGHAEFEKINKELQR